MGVAPVVVASPLNVIVQTSDHSITVEAAPDVVVVQTSETASTVIVAAVQGPPGPVGPAGQAISTLTQVAPAGISAYLAAADVAGVLQLADSGTLAHVNRVLGIVTAAAVPGAVATVQYGGPVTFNGWNWDVTKPVFISVAGALTQIPPTVGFAQIIGIPVNPTTLLVTLQPPVLLN